MRQSLEFDLKSKLTDEYGRYILLNATVQGCNYIMGNIYRFTRQTRLLNSILFSKNYRKNLTVFFIDNENHKIIIGGDFNVVNDPDLDCCGGTPKEKESTKIIHSICLNYDLIDIWRTRNPDCKLFTGSKKSHLSRED